MPGSAAARGLRCHRRAGARASRGYRPPSACGPCAPPVPAAAAPHRSLVLLRRTGSRHRQLRVKRVLLLATTTGYQIRSFGEAARARRRHARAGDRPVRSARGSLVRSRDSGPVSRRGSRPWTRRLRPAVAQQPDAVLAVGDQPTVLAAHINAALGLPGNPPAAAARSRNKLQAREAFRRAGLPTPEFQAVSLHDDPGVARGGDRRIQRCSSRWRSRAAAASCASNDAGEFVAAFERLRALMLSPDIRARARCGARRGARSNRSSPASSTRSRAC